MLIFMRPAVPPNIKGEEVNATAMFGQPVELHCQSDAVPPPTLSWRKDGRPLFRKPGLTLSPDGSLLKVEHEQGARCYISPKRNSLKLKKIMFIISRLVCFYQMSVNLDR